MKKNLIFIAGLCVLENEQIAFKTAKYLKKLTDKYPNIDFIFKASFDKANRTSVDSFRGVGFRQGMGILGKIKAELQVKILNNQYLYV